MELLTVDELAEILRLTRNRVVRMARNGEMPAVVLDGRLRFDSIEIENWVRQNRINPMPR
jgi:excisionase family DNA binding protein